jgi:hypothetical protein
VSGGFDWNLDGLAPEAAELYRAVDWSAAACRSSWLPTGAWFPVGWGAPASLTDSSPRSELEAAAQAIGFDAIPESSLVLAALLHWVEIRYDQNEIGRRSPMRRLALATCASCPIREECSEYAVAVPAEYGVWGGQDDKERRLERARRRRRRHHR